MGADTMISILEAAPWLKDSRYELILQCQSKTPALRQYLSESGWRITEETVVRDGRFLYTVMQVQYQPEYPRLTIGQYYFPPALLENPARELPEYYCRTLFSLRRTVISRGDAADPLAVTALKELEALAETPDLSWLKENEDDHCQ
jgi:tRNA A22 N-methylase